VRHLTNAIGLRLQPLRSIAIRIKRWLALKPISIAWEKMSRFRRRFALLRNLEALIIDDDCTDNDNELGLGGSIPTTIGTLTQLTDLVTTDHGDELDGSIPSELTF
jgi:hypothetical protein